MSEKMQQSTLFRGIYEFEDPSGSLLAAKIPTQGSADLYDGTVVVVRPNQCCVFIYKGKVAEVFMDGTHTLATENVPILTSLANYELGFENPLRAELWFFSGQVFTARRWGTATPLLITIGDKGTLPIRMYGLYSIVLRDPIKFFATMVGTRSCFDITEVEEFVQGQIQELAPNALKVVKKIEDLNSTQEDVSKKLEQLLEEKLANYGLKVIDVQVQSISPGSEVMKAMESKAAMEVIGDPKTYLLYQAAQSLNQLGQGDAADRGNDPMQMMLGLMLGKNLMDQGAGAPVERSKSEPARVVTAQQKCKKCNCVAIVGQKFCSECGERL
jgi:membrane protease subunit (stomatin/prohibitin family)